MAPPGQVRLTHPARWGERRRRLLVEAAHLVWLPVPQPATLRCAVARPASVNRNTRCACIQLFPGRDPGGVVPSPPTQRANQPVSSFDLDLAVSQPLPAALGVVRRRQFEGMTQERLDWSNRMSDSTSVDLHILNLKGG